MTCFHFVSNLTSFWAEIFCRGNEFSHLGIQTFMEGLNVVPNLTLLDLRSSLTPLVSSLVTWFPWKFLMCWLQTTFHSYNHPDVEGAAAIAHGLRHVSVLQELQLWYIPPQHPYPLPQLLNFSLPHLLQEPQLSFQTPQGLWTVQYLNIWMSRHPNKMGHVWLGAKLWSMLKSLALALIENW